MFVSRTDQPPLDRELALAVAHIAAVTLRRQKADDALREREARLRLVTENMVDGITQVDADLSLAYVSPSITRLFGHDPAAMIGQSLTSFVHPNDLAQLKSEFQAAIAAHAASARLEFRLRHSNGEYRWVESEARLLYDDQGSLSGAIFGSRDISDRKQIELERQELIHELQSKNQELDRFTYTVSHDLRSPLITIRGFLGFVERDIDSGNMGRVKADLARIMEATHKMQRLLEELLELSRIGRMMNPPQSVSFEVIAREAVELVQGRLAANDIRIEIAPGLPLVYGDRARLVEVMQNLVDNACKFMGNQPHPRIEIGQHGLDADGRPVLSVRDNGIGIEQKFHDHVFGLFNKLDPHAEGIGGFGLSLVKRIIEVHGGRIWVESEGNGNGTAFCFTLPTPARHS